MTSPISVYDDTLTGILATSPFGARVALGEVSLRRPSPPSRRSRAPMRKSPILDGGRAVYGMDKECAAAPKTPQASRRASTRRRIAQSRLRAAHHALEVVAILHRTRQDDALALRVSRAGGERENDHGEFVTTMVNVGLKFDMAAAGVVAGETMIRDVAA